MQKVEAEMAKLLQETYKMQMLLTGVAKEAREFHEMNKRHQEMNTIMLNAGFKEISDNYKKMRESLEWEKYGKDISGSK